MKQKIIPLVACICSSILTLPTVLAATTQTPPKQQKQFVQTVSDEYHLSPQKIQTILSHAKYLPNVITKITTPYESKPYNIYQKHFLNSERIIQGNHFWNTHKKTLALAEKKYGVDPSVIVAILGVETLYGQQIGTYPVLDTLYTLSFYYPPRADFFTKELGQFLVMCHNQHLSPYTVLGSYAGAFGMPQFMPSSYRAYGVDYSKNHHIDLMHNSDDVIMSVANYLAKAGWQAHQPVASHISNAHPSHVKPYLTPDATPMFSTQELAKNGLYNTSSASPNQFASVIALKGSQHDDYWVAFPNFKSIMKYNPSVNYAMAVYQLSVAIRKEHGEHTT